MKPRDVLLGVVVAAVWGLNFVLIRLGLNGVPPLLLCAVRFLLAAVPLIFFVPRPRVPLWALLGYGLPYFALQFGFVFTAIDAGLPAGLASLLLQIQAFFTMALSAVFFRDFPNRWTLMGAFIAFAGIGVVASHSSGQLTPMGLVLVLLGAFSFASGNIFSKYCGNASPLGLVVWGSWVAFPFLAILSYFIEGPSRIVNSLQHISWSSVLAIAYIVYISTFLGFTLWSVLLSRYSASNVATFTLLVPIFGLLGAWAFLGESLPPWKIEAAVLVIGGLCLNIWGTKRVKKRALALAALE